MGTVGEAPASKCGTLCPILLPANDSRGTYFRFLALVAEVVVLPAALRCRWGPGVRRSLL